MESHSLERAVANRDDEKVKHLVKNYGGDEMCKRSYAGRVMVSAARRGNLNIVEWLLTGKWAEISFRGPSGRTALDWAIVEGKLNIVRWLVGKAGADVENTGEQGKTALLLAANFGHLAIVKWLIKNGGSNVAKVCQHGMNALFQAPSTTRGYDVVHWLLKKGIYTVSDELWLHMRPSSGYRSVPPDLMHFMLLQRRAPMAVMGQFIHHTPNTKSMFSYASKLRKHRSAWLLEKKAIVTDSAEENLLTSLVQVLLDYSDPSVREMWSSQLGMTLSRASERAAERKGRNLVESKRRNPERTTRKRRASELMKE